MPPAIQSFIQAPEQVLLNQARATVPSVLQPASSSHASGSSSAPKFHAMSGQKRQHAEGGGDDDDDDDEDGDDDEGAGTGKGKNPRKRNSTSTGRRKIEISFIDNKAKRHVSFTKRKAGLMKKAYELSTLTGTECLIVVVSETGLVYTYATPSLKPIVDLDRGREFIGLALRGELTDDTAPSASAKIMDLDVDELAADAAGTHASGGGAPPSTAADFYSLDNLYPPAASQAADPTPSSSSVAFSSIPTGYPYADSYATLPAFPAQPFAAPAPPPAAPAVTPFERSLTEHKVAFDTYNARVSEGYGSSAVHGAHQFSDVARNWKIPRHERTPGGGLGATADMPLPVQAQTSRATMDERKVSSRREAAAALVEAKTQNTIASYIKAHRLQVMSQRPIPPIPGEDADLTSPPPGIETTLALFKIMCEEQTHADPAALKPATQHFLETYLPAQSYSQKKLHEARQHLALFFDYAEGHGLISPDVHMDLTSFSFAPASSTTSDAEARGAAISSKLARFVSGRGSDEGTPEDSVQGTFAVYRIRSNFCLLTQADDGADASLSPFKVRLPRDLTPYLKMDDCMDLSIRRSPRGSSWVPFRFTEFQPTAAPDAEESDIDPSSYEAEVERLLTLPRTEENDQAIKLSQEVVGMLTRARTLLNEGDVPDSEM